MMQTPEQIAAWAAHRASAEIKPQGRAGHLAAEQKTAIRLAYLEAGGTVTMKALGERFGVNRDTVSACLKGAEFDTLRGAVESEARAAAIQRLKAAVIPAADAWVRAVDEAADKGDHKPAKDLLMHTGTIEPLDEDGRARGPLVLIYVGNSGVKQPGRAVSCPDDGVSRPYSANGQRLTREEADELGKKHDLCVQLGGRPEDVTIGPMLSPAATSK